MSKWKDINLQVKHAGQRIKEGPIQKAIQTNSSTKGKEEQNSERQGLSAVILGEQNAGGSRK